MHPRANPRIADLDLDQDVAIVLSKGRPGPRPPFGAGQTIDSYLRMRAATYAASEPWLRVGKRGA
jgi:hypothetical protein